jgi:hypothetical protein
LHREYSNYNQDAQYLDDAYNNTPQSSANPDRPKFQPTKATQARLRAKQVALAAADNPPVTSTTEKQQHLPPQPPKKSRDNQELPQIGSGGPGGVKEDFLRQPFKNPENAFKEAMNQLAQDEDWEKKCHAMNTLRRLCIYHEDLVVNNIHSIVLALCQEVKNLRSQVSRFALITFGDLFVNLKKFMDVDLDVAVKNILQKNGESNDFIRSDVEKCLDKMIQNVTTIKAMIALLNGGASHKNPLIRRTTAQYIYKCCELMGPGKVLSGIKDVTDRVLQVSSQFVCDGPPDIRWFGRKIFHILMSHEDFDRLLNRHLSESTRKNIKEILDNIRVKGPGEAPTDSARFGRKSIRSVDNTASFSAGLTSSKTNSTLNNDSTGYNQSPQVVYASPPKHETKPYHPKILDVQSQEHIKNICTQLRNTDFRERIEAIEKFQILCETQSELAVPNLVPVSESRKLFTCN